MFFFLCKLAIVFNEFIGYLVSVLLVRAPGYTSRGPGSIPGATSLSEKYWVWNVVHSDL
jgi:hypothetical protein